MNTILIINNYRTLTAEVHSNKVIPNSAIDEIPNHKFYSTNSTKKFSVGVECTFGITTNAYKIIQFIASTGYYYSTVMDNDSQYLAAYTTVSVKKTIQNEL